MLLQLVTPPYVNAAFGAFRCILVDGKVSMWMRCRTASMPPPPHTPTKLSSRPLDTDSPLNASSKLNDTALESRLQTDPVSALSVDSLGFSELRLWPRGERASLHESLFSAFLSLFLACKTCKTPPPPLLSFCRCALVALHPVFLSLSLSLSLLHLCFSHTTGGGGGGGTLGQTLTSGGVRPLL